MASQPETASTSTPELTPPAARTCFITGASRGIGLATALRFARTRANIVAIGRTEPHLEQAAEQIAAAGGTCFPLVADIGEADDVRDLIDAAVQRFGRIDILVNNAGAAPLATIDKLTLDDFERVFDINIAGVFNTTQAVWPVMTQQGGGVIVNVSSLASVDPFPGFSIYGASKAWVNVFTHAVAAEGKPHNIRVYAVAPGAVETKLLRATFPTFPAEQCLAPDEVAAVIEGVCDPRLASASGQTVIVRK